MSFLNKANYWKEEREKGEGGGSSLKVVTLLQMCPRWLWHTDTQLHIHTNMYSNYTNATRVYTLWPWLFIWGRVCFLSCLTVPVDTFSHHDPDWHTCSLKTHPAGKCVWIMSPPHKRLSSPLTPNSRWNPPVNSLQESSFKYAFV